MQVEFDRYSLTIDGERKLIRSGSLHYFRLPDPELWRDRIEQMRQAGLNAVDLYYPWNYHSEVPGEYSFSGFRDIDRLHQMIDEAGLYLIARPGPYVCAEIDLGGLPAWLLREPGVTLRCRSAAGFAYSSAFMEAVGQWFAQVLPRIARCRGLLLLQVENEYTLPAPMSTLPRDLADLLFRWFGVRPVAAVLMRLDAVRRRLRRASASDSLERARGRGQTNAYMRELFGLARAAGIEVPIFHNDLSSDRGRQSDVDLMAIDRYPITDFRRDWRNRRDVFASFRGDEAGLDRHRPDNPVFFPELQGGWYDGWGGPGYARVRELLGPEAIENATVAALAERATLWNYYVFCGGVTWGYMSSPDVYSSYDYGAPVPESGRTGARYRAVSRLNEFLKAYESELVRTDRVEAEPWCPEHLATRQGPTRRFVFLRNARREPRGLPTPEPMRSELAPWEAQIRVYTPDGKLEAVSPEPEKPLPLAPPPRTPLPALEEWSFTGASPQLDPAYDDSGWATIPPERVEACVGFDIDALGLHYGFAWYRGSFRGPLDRLLLDARHCWAVWINRELIAAGDQFRNPLGVGPDGARLERIDLRPCVWNAGANVIVICVESLGHNKGFADDARNPRGIVRLDTGSTPISWKFRGGLVRGERGMNPIVAFSGIERGTPASVALPHAWEADPAGVGLYETRFRLDGLNPGRGAIGAVFDPGRGKANLYLNGHLLGRYWPERGPQIRFLLPWGILDPSAENHLAIALWKRTPRAALGKVRLELLDV
ncbi:MAG: beta-galactosidase [Myxococcales bacterium]|nr:beta-galactosidase [Myxococcales bacterium]